jgi:hypothetical protein
MIFGWESLDSHREFPTNKSVGVLSIKFVLFCGVPFVQDTVAMLPLIPGHHGPQFADQGRDPPSS